MPLTTLTFHEFVSNWLTSWAADMQTDPNLPVGNIARATAEADGAQAVALQFIAEEVVTFARATTATGVDLDSWMAQFSFPRLPAVAGTGVCVFSSLAPLSQPAFVPIGTVIQAPGGAIQYQVIPDNNQPTYNSAKQAYVLPANQTSMNVTVQSLVPGVSNNVQANTLTQIVTTLFGIPTVNNTSAIQDGASQESDEAYRIRFIEYLNGLSKATESAILEAVQSVQAGLKISLFENILFVGNPPTSLINPYYGNIAVIFDDGSGNPSNALKAAVYNAVNATRAFSIQFQVLPPTVIVPSIELNIKVSANYVTATVETDVQNAIVKYVNALPIGSVIYLSQVELAAMLVPGVVAIEPASLLIDSAEADLTLNLWEEAIIAATNVAVGTYT